MKEFYKILPKKEKKKGDVDIGKWVDEVEYNVIRKLTRNILVHFLIL